MARLKAWIANEWRKLLRALRESIPFVLLVLSLATALIWTYQQIGLFVFPAPPTGQPVGQFATEGIGSILAAIVGQLIRLTWPAVLLICVIVIFLSPAAKRVATATWSRTKRVKVGQVELELSSETAKKLHFETGEAFSQFRQVLNSEISRQVNAFKLRDMLEQTVASSSISKKILNATNFRCTIYIRDILFEDTLYQATEYYPWDGKLTSGRTFSSRFGIIGRAWRTGVSLGEGSVPTDEQVLITQWGMTKEEARRGSRSRPSYLCAVLRAPDMSGNDVATGLPVGVLFADSTDQNAFGDAAGAEAVAKELEDAAFNSGLRHALKELGNDIAKYSASIKI